MLLAGCESESDRGRSDPPVRVLSSDAGADAIPQTVVRFGPQEAHGFSAVVPQCRPDVPGAGGEDKHLSGSHVEAVVDVDRVRERKQKEDLFHPGAVLGWWECPEVEWPQEVPPDRDARLRSARAGAEHKLRADT